MKSLAVLSPSLFQKVKVSERHILKMDNDGILLGFIETEDTYFDFESKENSLLVLVRKLGFSLNYSDLSVMLWAWSKLKSITYDSYYSIGSEFCGIVESVGNEVKELKKGDFVIPDCFYPGHKLGVSPGIPTNHGSKELEIIHNLKLLKINPKVPIHTAATLSIGVQTAKSMIKKATIKPEHNVLITSPSSNTSLFLLTLLKSVPCNLYVLSFKGGNHNKIKESFPNIVELYTLKKDEISEDVTFDIVLDPFSDTYLEHLLSTNKVNFGGKYISCGIHSQSPASIKDFGNTNLPILLSKLITQNIAYIGNCLGSTEDLKEGIKELEALEYNVIIDSIYDETCDIKDFIEQSFNKNSSRFGKVSFLYRYL